jgi:hypothetical protein
MIVGLDRQSRSVSGCGFKPIESLRVYRVPFFGGGALSGRGAGVPPRCPPVQVANLRRLYMYSRVGQCEIINIEVYYIDFSRPSPESKSGRGIHYKNYRSGYWERFYVAISRNRALLHRPKRPKSQTRQSADITRKQRSTARLQTDARPSRDGSEHSSGPARKHTATFEPAAWSWVQITSGSGAPKRVLSEDRSNHIQTSKAKLSTYRSPSQALKTC